MKKFILLIFSIFLLGFVACSNKPANNSQKTDINKIVAMELEKLDQNYSDETLKALSVVLRTNLTINSISSDNQTPNEKYLLIADKTKHKMLKNENNNLIEISLENNQEYSWQKSIKKSKLLEFALKNKVNLTNLSNIEPVIENGKIKGINIANKYFDYSILAEEFGLESNIIENIENNKSEIVIKGKNKGFYNNFDLEKAEQLSNKNYNYEQILNEFFDDLNIN